MDKPLPVEAARGKLVELVRKHICGKDWPENSAEQLVELHLDPRNFPMHRHCDVARLKDGLAKGLSSDELRHAIEFEDTRSIHGICRVMVRTHLNRQGIGHVTRGESKHERTLARRVLGPFDGDFDPLALADWANLLKHWLAFAEKHPELFDAKDTDSLEAMARLGPQPGAAKKQYAGKVHDNWAKVVLGIHTGLVYLQKRFDMDAGKLWAIIESCESDRDRASALVEQARKDITGFGEALAPSFFADLGATCFIKPDTHIQQAMKAYSGRDVPKRQIVQILLNAVEATDPRITPRALDKLLFFGDGGPLYFLGETAPRANRDRWKQKFRKALIGSTHCPP